MILYRSRPKASNIDYSASYTCIVDGEIHKGSCFQKHYGDSSFNNSVVIGDNVVDCGLMFSTATHFNSNVVIGNNVVSCWLMFNGTGITSQNFIFPETVMNLAYAFRYCNLFNGNIFIKGNTWRNIYTLGLLQSTNNSRRKNIYFNAVLNNKFNMQNSTSIVNGVTNNSNGIVVTWTTMTNGFYNASFNVYCYYNYEG